MNVHELVRRFDGVTDAPKPMIAAKQVLESLRDDMNGVSEAVDYLTGVGGNALQAFYRAPDLSMLKVSFPNGRRTPPHNHGTWAAILVLSGSEKNTLYKRGENGELVRSGEIELSAGSVLPMPADVIHVVECLSDEPAVGLHIYGANVLGVDRQMWDPETLEELALDWDAYEPLARKASAAAAAPLS